MDDKEYWDNRQREEQKQRLARLKSVGWEPKFSDYDFDSFCVTEKNRNMFTAAQAYGKKPFNLRFYGSPGNGKTRLSWAALYTAIRVLSLRGRFIRWDDFEKNALDNEYNRNFEFVDGLVSGYDIIVVDDIFDNGSNKTLEKHFKRLLDKWQERRKSGLLVSHNGTLEDLAGKLQNDRILSRMVELFPLAIENLAPDYRVRNLRASTVKDGEVLTPEMIRAAQGD